MHPDTIYTKTAKGVLEVKNKTIRLPRELGLIFLAVDGKAKKTPVKIGFNDGAKVEVVSGLSETVKVILVGKMILTDGQAVNVQEAK